ncbi:pre-toxin TG domain-containing protein [Clostridium sp. MSJ-8]|uniref:pre-toxin TG domain-containing protein n=1 Tax=Clostridium sp. MSJ-8 TaxID=2841510 RepID=UPI001C0EB630|nr:pre-toxin TG domain-containing protein [Clostridium sp. MSJ-8]
MSFVVFGKTLIEVISGENLITHEKLSFLQRIIGGVSLIPIGAIAKCLKGIFKGGINSLLRRAGKSAITDIGEEVTEAVIKDEVKGLEKNIASIDVLSDIDLIL